jgi:hypothetical protein
VPGEAGGYVPDPVAERVRVGVAEFLIVVAAEEAGPGCEVGGDVWGDDLARVDLPGLRRQVAQPHGLGGADAARLDDGALAVDGVDVLGVVAARDAGDPGVGDVRAGDGVLPAALVLVVGQVPQVPAGRPDPPRDPEEPAGPVPRAACQPGDLRCPCRPRRCRPGRCRAATPRRGPGGSRSRRRR